MIRVRISPDVIRQVSDELQQYVYALVDPSTQVPFYVGKGRGLRHAAHLADALDGRLPGLAARLERGAANAYLGLRVGLTVSASIPAAVMAVALFRALKRGTILEANIVQTRSATSSGVEKKNFGMK